MKTPTMLVDIENPGVVDTRKQVNVISLRGEVCPLIVDVRFLGIKVTEKQVE